MSEIYKEVSFRSRRTALREERVEIIKHSYEWEFEDSNLVDSLDINLRVNLREEIYGGIAKVTARVFYESPSQSPNENLKEEIEKYVDSRLKEIVMKGRCF